MKKITLQICQSSESTNFTLLYCMIYILLLNEWKKRMHEKSVLWERISNPSSLLYTRIRPACCAV
jgi:hypothetical protein